MGGYLGAGLCSGPYVRGDIDTAGVFLYNTVKNTVKLLTHFAAVSPAI